MIAELARLVAAVTSAEGGPVVEAPAALEGALQKALEAHGWRAVRVDRAPVYGQETLLHALYQAGEFPGYFSFGWDALLDCLSDWSWSPAAGHALIFRDLDLLEARAPEAARTFLELVGEARGERETPLRVVRLVPPPEQGSGAN